MSDPVIVSDNSEASRLEIHADGKVAELSYRTRPGRLVLLHTEVPDSLGGRGLGGQLVLGAIGKAAHEGLTIVPLCPFAHSWLERHPDDAARVKIDWAEPDGRLRRRPVRAHGADESAQVIPVRRKAGHARPWRRS